MIQFLLVKKLYIRSHKVDKDKNSNTQNLKKKLNKIDILKLFLKMYVQQKKIENCYLEPIESYIKNKQNLITFTFVTQGISQIGKSSCDTLYTIRV